MNIKRGLFRVWLVLSVLFALTLAAYTVESVQKAFKQQAENAKWSEVAIMMIPTWCGQARGVLHTDYDTQDKKAKPDSVDQCWYELPKFRKLYPEYADLSDDDLSYQAYQKVGITTTKTESPWWIMASMAAFAVGWPLALLALGSAIYWALAGFARLKKAE